MTETLAEEAPESTQPKISMAAESMLQQLQGAAMDAADRRGVGYATLPTSRISDQEAVLETVEELRSIGVPLLVSKGGEDIFVSIANPDGVTTLRATQAKS